ncbi:HalOD1 output domain-containing protein [Halomarina ordinaria]|uniref:HalOD1 output domain-containing protein n=1 Tax=Halomarina ordinaria TaxID=3033939 RepID=A0ABD5U458_9EURY|nr:HalOD1 output domain-containing protein [Halomarina sp. PSRA2]
MGTAERVHATTPPEQTRTDREDERPEDDVDGDPSLSVAVVEAVGEALDVDPQDLDALYGAVDPDALDALFRPDADCDVSVRFHFADCLVTARSDGTVLVEP